MNFSEFKKLMGAEPGNRDPETLRARESSPEFDAVAAEAEAFEQKLGGALRVQAPDDLLGQLRAISQQPVRRRSWIPLALAASFVLFIGAAGLVWKQSRQWDSVEAYVADHYSHDGSRVIAQIGGGISEQDISKILARLHASAEDPLSGLIEFIKFCPTPDGRGAHMVVSTEQGPVTIIYMPNIRVQDGETIRFDLMQALLVNLERGSAAIIGEQEQNIENMVVVVRNSLRTGLVDT